MLFGMIIALGLFAAAARAFVQANMLVDAARC